jgi:hypothetical protein
MPDAWDLGVGAGVAGWLLDSQTDRIVDELRQLRASAPPAAAPPHSSTRLHGWPIDPTADPLGPGDTLERSRLGVTIADRLKTGRDLSLQAEPRHRSTGGYPAVNSSTPPSSPSPCWSPNSTPPPRSGSPSRTGPTASPPPACSPSSTGRDQPAAPTADSTTPRPPSMSSSGVSSSSSSSSRTSPGPWGTELAGPDTGSEGRRGQGSRRTAGEARVMGGSWRASSAPSNDNARREGRGVSAGHAVFLRWCAREDLNLHPLSGTRPSTVRVCLFRHSRVVASRTPARRGA